MKFILEDGYIIKLEQSEDEEFLIAKSYDKEGEFLDRERINKENLYIKLFC